MLYCARYTVQRYPAIGYNCAKTTRYNHKNTRYSKPCYTVSTTLHGVAQTNNVVSAWEKGDEEMYIHGHGKSGGQGPGSVGVLGCPLSRFPWIWSTDWVSTMGKKLRTELIRILSY